MIEKSEKLINKEQVKSFSSLILIGVALVLAMCVFLKGSLAWFAQNDVVSAKGISVSAKGLPDADVYLMIDDVRVDESAVDLFSDMIPGQTANFKIGVKNNTDGKISFFLAIAASTAEEDTAYVVDGLYHYFGSQIRINSIKNGSDDLLTRSGADSYLLPLADDLYSDGLPPTALDSEYDFSLLEERTLTEELVIDAGGEVFLDVELEFVDNNTLQNAYIDFGKTEGQTLARTLLCYLFYAE